MRYMPKFTDDYDATTDDLTASGMFVGDLDELIDGDGDEWALVDSDDLELLKSGTAH